MVPRHHVEGTQVVALSVATLDIPSWQSQRTIKALGTTQLFTLYCIFRASIRHPSRVPKSIMMLYTSASSVALVAWISLDVTFTSIHPYASYIHLPMSGRAPEATSIPLPLPGRCPQAHHIHLPVPGRSAKAHYEAPRDIHDYSPLFTSPSSLRTTAV